MPSPSGLRWGDFEADRHVYSILSAWAAMVTIREFREYKAKGAVGHDRHASLESATESSQAVYMGYHHDQRK